jgi:quinolinate synthase
MLNPEAQIYFPIPQAQCPMAAFGSPELLIKYKKENPGIPIALYINSTTEAKQYADVIVTSSSALEICKKIQAEFHSPKIGFSPDKNLGRYIQKQTGIPMDIIPPNGHCYVHEQYTTADIKKFRKKFPTGKVIVHPECPKDVIDHADFTGSTTAMYKYIQDHPQEIIGIGTEQGLIDRAKHDFPTAQLYPLIDTGICKMMKMFTLEILERTLQNLNDRTLLIEVPKDIAEKALKPINKMFELIGKK